MKTEARRPKAEGKWSGTTVLICGTLLVFGLVARLAWGSDLSRGISPQDGQKLYASDLDNLIDLTSINSSFYTGKPLDTTPIFTDLLLLYSPSLAGFQKVQLTTVASYLPALAGSNAIAPTSLTSTDLVLVALSYGTNSANPAGTATNPVTVAATLTQLKLAAQTVSNSVAWLQPITNANFTAGVSSNYYASPLAPGNVNGTAPYTFYTNGPLRARVVVDWTMGCGGRANSFLQILYTNKTQSLLQVKAGIGGDPSGLTNWGSFTFFLNPGDIWSVIGSGGNNGGGYFNTILGSQFYAE